MCFLPPKVFSRKWWFDCRNGPNFFSAMFLHGCSDAALLVITNQIIEKCLKKNNEETVVHSNKFVGFPHAWLNLYHRNHFYICIASDPHSKKKSEVTRLKEIKECVYDSLGYLFETGWQEICRTCLNIGVSEQTTKSKSKQIGGNKKYLHPAGRTPVFITFCINHF